MSDATHWLYRPRTRRRLAQAGGVVLALSLLAELLVHLHPAFGFDAWFGFNAVYGFLACVAMVLFARLLGLLVKRPSGYYGQRPGGAEPAGPAAEPAPPRRRRRRR